MLIKTLNYPLIIYQPFDWYSNLCNVYVDNESFWWTYALSIFGLGLSSILVYIIIQQRKRFEALLLEERRAVKRQKELNELKRRMYTNLSNELRTPSILIMDMITQMQQNPQKYFGEGSSLIEGNGKKLIGLINRLMDITRLEQVSMLLELEQSSHTEAVHESTAKNLSSDNDSQVPLFSVQNADFVLVKKMETAFIKQVKQIVNQHYSDEDFALPQLCQKMRMSRSQLFRKMKAQISVSPSEFIRCFRLKQAKELLETTDMTVSEVAWEVGFKSLPHFSKTFHNTFGYSPSEVSPSWASN